MRRHRLKRQKFGVFFRGKMLDSFDSEIEAEIFKGIEGTQMEFADAKPVNWKIKKVMVEE